jgi:hypothetical protein
MSVENAGIAEGLRLWWPLVGAIAGQLLALGVGIEIVRRLRSDFKDHDAKDDKRFDAMGLKLDTRLEHIHERISDLREDLARGRRDL